MKEVCHSGNGKCAAWLLLEKPFAKNPGALIVRQLEKSAAKSAVSYRSGDDFVSAYLAQPSRGLRHPAIILIHEWWGLTDCLKQQAQRYATQGYVALAVDLYRGKVGTTPGEARSLMRKLPEERALQDVEAAFAYLTTRPDVDPKRIGSIGWSMGGGWSIRLAENQPKLAAFVVNYGPLPANPTLIARIRAPVLGNFGVKDKGIPPVSVQAFEKVMNNAGKSVDIRIYQAGHGFSNPDQGRGYESEAAQDSQRQSDAFFERYLK